MNATQSNQPWACPECGAEQSADATECWLCRLGILPQPDLDESPDAETSNTPVSPFVDGASGIPYEHHARFQFRLASMMMLMTLAAVLLGIFRMAPGLAILLAIFFTPALIRVWVLSARNKERGQSMTMGQKTLVFSSTMAATVGIVALVIFSLGGIIFLICIMMVAQM